MAKTPYLGTGFESSMDWWKQKNKERAAEKKSRKKRKRRAIKGNRPGDYRSKRLKRARGPQSSRSAAMKKAWATRKRKYGSSGKGKRGSRRRK
jgi:hypothetical protein